MNLKSGLYVTATPIGTLADVSYRAVEVLKGVDGIACEDTRVTRKLLSYYGIDTPLFAYHDHSSDAAREKLLSRIEAGERIALVSDAGTPLISDPGYRLVREAQERGLYVTGIPGASALTTALSLCGLPTDRFYFSGFLPTKAGQRQKAIAGVGSIDATLVFYESAKRLALSLSAMAETLGAREAAVCRELTKKFEEVRRGSLSDLAAQYKSEGSPKGEIVIVVGPPTESTALTDKELIERLGVELRSDSLRDAVATVTEHTGEPRKRVYELALQIRNSARDA